MAEPIERNSDGKKQVRDFWDEASCGERLYLDGEDAAGYRNQARERYLLEPYIPDFAGFGACEGQRILEIGVGLGADHEQFAGGGAELYGVDLTPRAAGHTTKRLRQLGFASRVTVGDAENLCLPDRCVDVVYSWGVLHHSPDTPRAIREVHRVLREGGEARIMIYHRRSLVGVMLWIRYALLRGRPGTGLDEIYARYLESPGTKAYSMREAREMFNDFRRVELETVLTHGDLLTSAAGQRHEGRALSIARAVWPRWLFRRCFQSWGLFMLIRAVK